MKKHNFLILFFILSTTALASNTRKVCVDSYLRGYRYIDFSIETAVRLYNNETVVINPEVRITNPANNIEMILVSYKGEPLYVAEQYLAEECPESEIGVGGNQDFPSDQEISNHNRDRSRPHTMSKGLSGLDGNLFFPVDECRPCGDFKQRSRYFHPGSDLCTDRTGIPARAIYSGVVVEVTDHCTDNYFRGKTWSNTRTTTCRNSRGFGNRVMLMHKTGSQIWYSGYHHLGDVYTEVGSRVIPGQVIGTVGSTGVSFNFHLHFEIMEDDGNNDGRHLRNNPAKYYDSNKMCQRYFFTRRN